MNTNPYEVLTRLGDTLNARKTADPSSSYTAKLFHKGQDAILKKVGEEAIEVIMASKDQDRAHLIYESADVLYHLMVLLCYHKIDLAEVMNELARREGTSGIAEKASRPKD